MIFFTLKYSMLFDIIYDPSFRSNLWSWRQPINRLLHKVVNFSSTIISLVNRSSHRCVSTADEVIFGKRLAWLRSDYSCFLHNWNRLIRVSLLRSMNRYYSTGLSRTHVRHPLLARVSGGTLDRSLFLKAVHTLGDLPTLTWPHIHDLGGVSIMHQVDLLANE
jgi:hypothetical protein